MEKCLVTTYKEIVSNNELPYFGGISFTVNANTNIQQLALSESSYVSHLKIVDGGCFSDSTYTEDNGTEITDNESYMVRIKKTSDLCKIVIFDDYDLAQIAIANLVEFDLSQLAYRDNLLNITLTGEKVGDISVFKGKTSLLTLSLGGNAEKKPIGNISNLKDLTSLTTLVMNTTNVEGDINVLDKLKNLTILQILNSKSVTGVLETLLQGLYANNKRSGTLDFVSNGVVKFKNAAVSGTISSTFSNSGISVSISNVVKATYDGTNWKDENNNTYDPTA